MPQQPSPYSLVNATGDQNAVALSKAALRRQLIIAAVAGGAGANNAGAALYTASQLASYALAVADATIALLITEN